MDTKKRGTEDYQDKLKAIATNIQQRYPASKIIHKAVDVQRYEVVESAVSTCAKELGGIDILINNAGLALGAPAAFHDLSVSDILTMNNTNINGPMFVTHAVLNASMVARNAGTILNITSVTGLETPPYPGEAVYHANKASQEAFTNALRNELNGTNIRVLALRPGCVATNFHSLRVNHDKKKYDSFFEGYQPLESAAVAHAAVAHAAVFMLTQPLNMSVKALDLVPSAQRSLNVFDRTWSARNT